MGEGPRQRGGAKGEWASATPEVRWTNALVADVGVDPGRKARGELDARDEVGGQALCGER